MTAPSSRPPLFSARWWLRVWCQTTGRHRGHVGHDDRGVVWACEGVCGEESVVPWAEVYRRTGPPPPWLQP